MKKLISFTFYESQISSWTDLNSAERLTLIILQQLSEISKDQRGTYITNDRLSSMVGLHPNRISSTITKLKNKGYITVQRAGATGRYIKTRDFNHSIQNNKKIREKQGFTFEFDEGEMLLLQSEYDLNHRQAELYKILEADYLAGISEPRTCITNRRLANLLTVTTRTISDDVKQLSDLGLVRITNNDTEYKRKIVPLNVRSLFKI
ncbi:hypothetical protein L2475_02330 [Lactobacillus gasseri]|nr:hypothetical protein [Lactobacillus gasseri]